MLCCAVLCCAVLCCAVLCCAVLCCAVLWCGVLCSAVPCCAVCSAPTHSRASCDNFRRLTFILLPLHFSSPPRHPSSSPPLPRGSQEAINFTRCLLLDNSTDLDGVCGALVTAAMDRGSADNISVIVVAFNQV